MADSTTQQPEANDEAKALAAAQAGYDRKARGTTPPAEVSTQASAAPLADPVQAPPKDTPSPEPDEPDLEATPEPAKPDPVAAVTEQLGALRAQVQELAKGDGAAAEVRKLHGEIGNINRTLKQLQAAKPADAPAAEDELAAALKQAEATAAEYPEIAGPFNKVLKALAAKVALAKPQESDPAPQPDPTPAQPAPAAPAQPTLTAEQVKQQAAIDALNEVHPDRLAINQTPEFKAWLATKPPEFQKTWSTTWNPAWLSKGYDEFKARAAAQKRKQDRVDAAIQPEGTGTGGPTTIPDEAGLQRGYDRVAKQRRF